MLLLALACTASPPATQSPAEAGPASGDSLVLAVPFDPGNLNPLVAPYALSGWYIDSVQPGLVLREVTPEGLRYRPALAERWDWSADGQVLTYTLKPGLVWSDGVPLTAADVAFTWTLIGDEKVASNWFDESRAIAQVEAVDERHVAFHFVHAGNPDLLQSFTIRGVVPEHVLKDADRASLRGHPSSHAPLSSGPWVVSAWQDNEKLVLEPNPRNTAFPEPHLQRIITRVMPEYSTRLIELQNGGIDYLPSLEVSDIPIMKRDYPQFKLLQIQSESMNYIGWNLRDARLADARVRRALTLAIDRDKLLADVLTVDGVRYGRPCVGTVPPNFGEWFNADIQPLPADKEQARALLAEAGWTDSDHDGLLDRGGEPFTIDLLVQSGIPQNQQIAVYAQAALAEVGVKLEIQSVEPNRFSALARGHEFEAILWSFGSRAPVDPTIQWHSTGQYNWMGYSDPETDKLLEELRTTTDIDRAKAISREVQARVYEAQPATFLWWEDGVAALNDRFEDVHFSLYNAIEQSELWWVPADKQRWN